MDIYIHWYIFIHIQTHTYSHTHRWKYVSTASQATNSWPSPTKVQPSLNRSSFWKRTHYSPTFRFPLSFHVRWFLTSRRAKRPLGVPVFYVRVYVLSARRPCILHTDEYVCTRANIWIYIYTYWYICLYVYIYMWSTICEYAICRMQYVYI